MSEIMLRFKNIKPLGNQIVTEAVRYDSKKKTDAGLILPAGFGVLGEIKHIQKVVQVGPTVRGIVPGDYVWIDFFKQRYFTPSEESLKKNQSLAGLDPEARASHVNIDGKIDYPTIMVAGEVRMLIYDNDVYMVGEPEE